MPLPFNNQTKLFGFRMFLSSFWKKNIWFSGAIQELGIQTYSNHLNTIQAWYSNSPPNQVIRPFKNWTKKYLKSQMFGFQVLGIQMVNVLTIQKPDLCIEMVIVLGTLYKGI